MSVVFDIIINMREISFLDTEIYHIFNRGVDKRTLFLDAKDLSRFIDGIRIFNTKEILGSLRSFSRHPVSVKDVDNELVDIIAYCVNPNHFHLLLKPRVEGGLEKIMHKLSMSYSKYFNTKYKRKGALFQGRFGAKHVDTNEYLLHVSAYINLNGPHSSWFEYLGERNDSISNPKIILEQFKNPSEYKKFAEEAWQNTEERKLLLKELEI